MAAPPVDKIVIAAVQMEASPAPTAERIAHAGSLLAGAAEEGAQLAVLPELFNIGYTYSDDNYRRAEALDGPTATWMKEAAARLNVHLAGSLLLRDRKEIYNAFLLFAPDGRMWRYDKLYPWGWERAYFRKGRDIAIADTDLGRFGMMVCWDIAHRNLWKRYAGRVDLMLISSCPPDVTNPAFHFPNGDRITFGDAGPVFSSMKGLGQRVFGEMLNEQTAWLGVPAVNTVGTGHIETDIPNAAISFGLLIALMPWLWRYLPQAGRVRMSCDFIKGCKVVDASGQVLTELEQAQGEGFTVAEVTLADEAPQPAGPQPPSRVPALGYLLSDVILPMLSIPVYRSWARRD